MTATLFYPALNGFFDSNGAPLSGGKIESYQPGTSTAKNTYPTKADAEAGTNPNANPVVLDSAGRAQIWLDGEYKLIIKTSAGVTIETVDEVGEATDAGTLPPNHISGNICSNNSTDSDHDIDISAGSCRDAADTFDMVSTETITIAIDQTAGAGSIDTGTVANNTIYAVWRISDSSGTNSESGIFSTSFSSPTMPTGYDKKRLVGAVKTDGSANIIGFTQVGDYFRYTGDVVQDISDNTITDQTFEIGTLSCPPSCIAHIYGTLSNSTETSTAGRVHIRTNGAEDQVNTTTEAFAGIQTNDTFDVISGIGSVLVDSSSQVQYAASEAAGTALVDIRTLGFWMLTRRDPV